MERIKDALQIRLLVGRRFLTGVVEGGAVATHAAVAELKRAILDEKLVRSASHATWGALLKAGVRIYEYQPTMFHCKLMIVDRHWVSLGSSNFDNRSFRLNDEANLNIYDREFAARQIEVFNDDIGRSKQVTLADWQNRPLKEKVLEKFAGLLSLQL